jgi:protein kinase A
MEGVTSHPTSAMSPLNMGTSPPQTTLPSINNLVHPPQTDGAGPSHASHTAALGHEQPAQVRQTKGKYTLADFEIQRTLGTGSFGRVHLVQSKHNQRFYAVKVLKKQQVVKMKQVEHTNDERKMLQEVKHPFLITLWGTFQDSKNLYMVMDFVEGGELFSLLRKTQVCTIQLSIASGHLAHIRSASPTPSPNSTRPKSPSHWSTSTPSRSSTAT